MPVHRQVFMDLLCTNDRLSLRMRMGVHHCPTTSYASLPVQVSGSNGSKRNVPEGSEPDSHNSRKPIVCEVEVHVRSDCINNGQNTRGLVRNGLGNLWPTVLFAQLIWKDVRPGICPDFHGFGEGTENAADPCGNA